MTTTTTSNAVAHMRRDEVTQHLETRKFGEVLGGIRPPTRRSRGSSNPLNPRADSYATRGAASNGVRGMRGVPGGQKKLSHSDQPAGVLVPLTAAGTTRGAAGAPRVGIRSCQHAHACLVTGALCLRAEATGATGSAMIPWVQILLVLPG